MEDVKTGKVKSVTELTEEDWSIARARFKIIEPIVTGENTLSIAAIARQNRIDRATLYRWLQKYERTGQVSSLINEANFGPQGKKKLSSNVEEIINDVIKDLYLDKQKLTIQKVCLEVTIKCKQQNLKPPSYKAIRKRILSISEEKRLYKRYGRTVAINKYKLIEGSFPGADYPLAAVQIDHTLLDIIVVDDVHRLPVGRPWITMAIDVYSRMVIGFYISLDPPGALGTGLCISNAILPKEMWLSKLNVDGKWLCYGVMKSIYIDNAKEFHGKMLERACHEYGIEINFRPVATPNYGGHIERLLGTVLKEIHTLPGTTFSNLKDRKDYEVYEKASFTIKELERWLATFIVKVYHGRIHKALHTTPLAKWTEGILGGESQIGIGKPRTVENELKLKLDFMPYVKRSIQRYGVVIDFIYYYHEVFSKWVNAYESPSVKSRKLRQFIFKLDPRDISCVYFLNPDINDYVIVHYRNKSYPSITVWEHRKILREIKRKGLVHVDEHMIFEAYQQLKHIEEDAVSKTQSTKKLRSKARKEAAVSSSIRNEFKIANNSDDKQSSGYTSDEDILPFEDIDDEPFTR